MALAVRHSPSPAPSPRWARAAQCPGPALPFHLAPLLGERRERRLSRWVGGWAGGWGQAQLVGSTSRRTSSIAFQRTSLFENRLANPCSILRLPTPSVAARKSTTRDLPPFSHPAGAEDPLIRIIRNMLCGQRSACPSRKQARRVRRAAPRKCGAWLRAKCFPHTIAFRIRIWGGPGARRMAARGLDSYHPHCRNHVGRSCGRPRRPHTAARLAKGRRWQTLCNVTRLHSTGTMVNKCCGGVGGEAAEQGVFCFARTSAADKR